MRYDCWVVDRGKGDAMIILEGPDGGGKTRLAARLVEALPELQLMPKAVGHDQQVKVDLKLWVDQALSLGFGPYLYDRFALLSEPIYGPIFRSDIRDEFTDQFWVMRSWERLRVIQPIVIYCLPPARVVAENVANDPDNLSVVGMAPQLWRAYYHQSLMTGLGHVFRWNYMEQVNGDFGRAVFRLAREIKAHLDLVKEGTR